MMFNSFNLRSYYWRDDSQRHLHASLPEAAYCSTRTRAEYLASYSCCHSSISLSCIERALNTVTGQLLLRMVLGNRAPILCNEC